MKNKRSYPEYGVWCNMKTRCYNPNATFYHRYGGRGIKVCDAWKHSFETFYKNMGPRPSDKHKIDRIDNDGNYEPSNCRWVTDYEQSRNKNCNIKFLNKIAKDVSLEHNGSHQLVTKRIHQLGWNVKKAFHTPKINPKKFQGKTLPQLSLELGGNTHLIYRRLRRGWDFEKACTTKAVKRG